MVILLNQSETTATKTAYIRQKNGKSTKFTVLSELGRHVNRGSRKARENLKIY